MTTNAHSDPVLQAINDYLSVNHDFWEKFTSEIKKENKKSILVDMMVSHPGYLMGNAITAKYLQKHFGCKVAAVVRSREHQLNIAMANSFCFDGFIFLDNKITIDSVLKVDEGFKSNDIKLKRNALTKLSCDGIELGDLIYDSYLRQTGFGTVNDIDDTLMQVIKGTVGYFKYFREIIRSNHVFATVLGHTVYSDFGALARASLAEGAQVYSKTPAAGPLMLRVYNHINEIREPAAQITSHHLDILKKSSWKDAVNSGKNIIESRYKGQPESDDYCAFNGFKADRKKYNRDELIRQHGLNPDLPIACIMSHCFADAPHWTKSILFNDNYEWLQETLETIKDIKNVNWLIKEHPYVDYFTKSDTAKKMAGPYCQQYSHIALVKDDVHTESIFSTVDAIITSTGTAGMECPARGVPCITAGYSIYSHLGFTIDSGSIDEYKDNLRRVPQLSPLSQKQIDIALATLFAFVRFLRVESHFIPEMAIEAWEQKDDLKTWRIAKELISRKDYAEDAYYRNLSGMLKRGENCLINSDLLHQ